MEKLQYISVGFHWKCQR